MSEEMATERVESDALAQSSMSIGDLVAQVRLVQEAMIAVMRKEEHYGVIPGTGTKPSLFKAGAEKLLLLFRLGPEYSTSTVSDGEHRDIESRCTLFHIPSGRRVGTGMGSCSTRESRYAYRSATRVCPHCGKDAIIKGREEYGGGFVCYGKKGGCGAKFKDGDKTITEQQTGRTPNPDLADQYNTVLKMANKRSLVAAVLNATGASDIFTQDIEDLPQAPAAAAKQDSAPSAAERLAIAINEADSFDGPGGIDELKGRANKLRSSFSATEREMLRTAFDLAEKSLVWAQEEEDGKSMADYAANAESSS